MSVKLRINVTEEILKRSAYCGEDGIEGENIMRYNGTTDNLSLGSNCAIALAIWDVIPFVWVNVEDVVFYESNEMYSDKPLPYSFLPKEASFFIRKFDRSTPQSRLKIYTISFDLEIPDEVINRISIEEITERLKSCNTVELA